MRAGYQRFVGGHETFEEAPEQDVAHEFRVVTGRGGAEQLDRRVRTVCERAKHLVLGAGQAGSRMGQLLKHAQDSGTHIGEGAAGSVQKGCKRLRGVLTERRPYGGGRFEVVIGDGAGPRLEPEDRLRAVVAQIGVRLHEHQFAVRQSLACEKIQNLHQLELIVEIVLEPQLDPVMGVVSGHSRIPLGESSSEYPCRT